MTKFVKTIRDLLDGKVPEEDEEEQPLDGGEGNG